MWILKIQFGLMYMHYICKIYIERWIKWKGKRESDQRDRTKTRSSLRPRPRARARPKARPRARPRSTPTPTPTPAPSQSPSPRPRTKTKDQDQGPRPRTKTKDQDQGPRLSKSRRFQPYPSTNKTRHNRCKQVLRNVERGLWERQQKVTLLLSLASILLVYYWLLINL